MKTSITAVILVLLAIVFGVDCSLDPKTRDELFRNYGITEEQYEILQSKIYEEQVLEMIHSVILNGLSAFGIPPLDPLSIEHLEIGHFQFQDYVELDYAVLDYIYSTKLNSFVDNYLQINVLQLGADFNFTFPEINFEIANYNISGILINIIPFVGDGAIKVKISDLTIAGGVTLGVRQETGYLYLSDLSLDLAIGGLNLMLTGLMGGGRLSDMVSDMVGPAVPGLVEQLKPTVGPMLQEAILSLINEQMDSLQLTVSDILNCLQNGDCFGTGTGQ